MNALKAALAGALVYFGAAEAQAATFDFNSVIEADRGICTASEARCVQSNRLNAGNAVDASVSSYYALGLGGSVTIGTTADAVAANQRLHLTEMTSLRTDESVLADNHREAIDIFALYRGQETFVGTLLNFGVKTIDIPVQFDAIKLVDVTARVFGTDTTSYDGYDLGMATLAAIDVAPVPLPQTAVLLLAGIAGFGALRRRKAKAT